MRTVISKDGTTIAFDKTGQGAAVILVGGMFEQRAMDSETAQLAAFPLMSQHFTVYHYDRRGRGDSTDTLPHMVAREIDDIEALIDDAGGSAFLFGISSGAALAFETALTLESKVKKLAMYEAPYNDDDDARQAWKTFRRQLNDVLAEGRHDDAVALFMTLMGVPADQLEAMRQYPMWSMWSAAAPAIAYDAAALGEDASIPVEKAMRLAMPTLVITGGASFPFIYESAAALAKVIPNAQHRILEGEGHEVTPEALAPVLVEFFTS